MEKQTTTSENFQKIFIDRNSQSGNQDSLLKKANEKYNEMVSKGLIKKRGYTLRGIEDNHLFHIKFNGY